MRRLSPLRGIAALMLAGWRQENFFKYARAHLGLDVLTTYAAETTVWLRVNLPPDFSVQNTLSPVMTFV